MNLLYIAQFHETCGYSHAAIGYLKSLIDVLPQNKQINLKILSVSLDKRKLSPDYHEGKTDRETLLLLDKYHISSQEELEDFTKKSYKCIWHMTSILPVILKRPGAQNFYKDIKATTENLIKGAVSNYHILAWETDEIPLEYKAAIENYNPELVITPSKWNTETVAKFYKSKTIPHLIEQSNIESEKVALPAGFEEKFVILSVSEWTHRKNFEGLIKSFITEFYDSDDVLLVIKTSPPPGMSKQDLIQNIKNLKNNIRTPGQKKQNIVFIVDYISSGKMKYLYEQSDVFCLTSFGEGFSLPLSEAVLNDVPVVCPRFGGHIDYLDASNPYFIDGMWDTVFDNPPYDSDGSWFVPSIRDTRNKLRAAYNDWTGQEDKLGKIALKNREKLNTGEFTRPQIGNTLIETLTFEEKGLTKIQTLKKQLQNLTLEEKIKKLKGAFSGEDCYILNCGPSLSDYDQEKLALFLKDKLVLSVKQAYNLFPEITDFHFFNCSNLPQGDSIFSPHYKNSDSTITIASSNYDEYRRWKLNQTSDLFFKVPIRTEINNEFLVRTGKIDDFLLNNSIERPCGPGIMYETVLFTAIHLGVKSITCIGWDLTMNKVNELSYQHFYGNTGGLVNRGDILDWEIKETRDFSKNMYEWLAKNNIELKLASNKSSLYDKIPRVNLEI